nr:hypothetical protein [Endozoicomonas sp.]
MQSEPEDDNPDAALDCSVNTSKARKHNQPDNSSSSLPAVKAARKEPSTTSANRAENSPATVPILFQRDQPGLSSDAGFDDESDSSFFNTIEREESKVSEVPKTPEDSLVDGDPLEEGRPTEDVLPAPINDSSSIGKQIVPINQALPVAKQAHIVSEASEEVEDDSQTAKQQTAKCAVSVSPQTELPLPKTATAFDPGSISQQADTSSPLQSQKKITPGQSKRPATKKTQPESITRASASLSDLSLKAKTHENTKTRKNEKLTFQKQTENKTAPAIEGKEDKAPIQSTDTHTRSTSYKSAEKRVSASVSDNLTGLSEKSVTECRTSTSLVRSSAKQVVTTHGNDTTGLRLFSDGKALYFNGELKDSGGKLQLRLTPANTGRSISDNTGLDSIKQPDCVIKIEEDLMRPATSEHSSSALAIPADANTHHHLKVSLLFNWDVPSTATVITINRQATHDDLANLQYCLNNHGTCDLGIDKSQLPALQLDKWFALESGRALGELEKAIEIDTAENLVVTVTDSAQFSIAPAPTKTPVEDVLSCSPPEQPEKDLSLANLNTPASVEEADKTRVPVSKQYPDGNYVPVEKILSVSTHPMMRQQATTDRQRQASGTEEIIHGMLGNFKETRGNSQPISMQAHEGKISGSSILGIKEPAQEMLKTLLPVTPEYPISVLAPRENGPLPDKELPSARTQPVAAQQANENKSQPEKTTAPSSTFTANAFNLAEKTAPLITASEAFDSGTNHSEGKDRDEDQDHPLSGRQTSETEEVISEGHTANTPALVASKAEPKELPTGKTIRAQKSKKTTGWGKLSLNNFSNIFARSEKKHPEPRQTAATSKDESLELVSVISEGLLKQ